RFFSLEDLNAQVRAWCDAVANKRVHGTTQKRPCDLLAEENPHALPDRAALAVFLAEERKVSRDGFVSFGGGRYGVPWAFAGRTVEVRENGYHVEVYSARARVAVHPKAVIAGTVLPAGQTTASVIHRRRLELQYLRATLWRLAVHSVR
ncbi:MAG: Mu transposase domain-containing protein, partial [Bacillota bacterium]